MQHRTRFGAGVAVYGGSILVKDRQAIQCFGRPERTTNTEQVSKPVMWKPPSGNKGKAASRPGSELQPDFLHTVWVGRFRLRYQAAVTAAQEQQAEVQQNGVPYRCGASLEVRGRGGGISVNSSQKENQVHTAPTR